jgi:hypothetical protein
MFTIIEDRSPYYIRFTYEGIDDVINYCKDSVKDKTFNRPSRGFHHMKYDEQQTKDLLALTSPIGDKLDLMKNRVSLFVTEPGYCYTAHKDGYDHRISINYTVQILDDKCVTSWYSDEELAGYPVDTSTWISREINDFDKTKHTPLLSMTAKPGECVLFNTEIYHDFDNSKSTNHRMVLTLRAEVPGIMYFDDAKKILFGL